ncbi:MAG: ABC transporter permease [Planctomycetota bacterium]
MKNFRTGLKELRRYPTALFGGAIILTLIIIAVYAVIYLPVGRAIQLWRAGEGVWANNPRNASPVLLNWLPGNNYPETVVVASDDAEAEKKVERHSDNFAEITITLPVEYDYDGFPREVRIFFENRYEKSRPHASLSLVTPDGRELELNELSPGKNSVYVVSQDDDLQDRLGEGPNVGLFRRPDVEEDTPLKGQYTLRVKGLVFEPEGDINARAVVYGQVDGLAGTDHKRRDIMVALLWGTPVALAFGVLAALGSTLSTLVIAAIGVWYGKWVDALIQRLTELNSILPVLPLLVLIGMLYSRSIWVMLGVVIALGVFSLGIKVYRAMLLPARNAPYIEAARAYGAGDLRIIFRYLIPRVLPVIVPQLVTLIPSYVFLEATLALLGLGDPLLPTWGKVLQDAFREGALSNGYYYWVLGPALLLMFTGLGFAMVGFAMDRIFNPRLRGR